MVKPILFLKHVAIEGPGGLEPFFHKNGFTTMMLDLSAGDDVPQSAHPFTAVVSLGGPMNVYEEDKYPFLRKEDIFIKKILQAKIPFLGICLGSQLLAKALEAKVVRSPLPEIGFFDVSLAGDGRQDVLFKNIHSPFKVFQWHEDMFEIAPGALHLASSSICPHQAFCARAHAYGLQFHVEIDRAMIITWMKEYWKLNNVLDCEKAQDILLQYDQFKPQLDQAADQIYKNFASLISQKE